LFRHTFLARIEKLPSDNEEQQKRREL
jgi:hypothetical protein